MEEKINSYIDSLLSYQEKMDLIVLPNKIARAPNLEQFLKEEEMSEKLINILSKLYQEKEELTLKLEKINKLIREQDYHMVKKLKENTQLWKEMQEFYKDNL